MANYDTMQFRKAALESIAGLFSGIATQYLDENQTGGPSVGEWKTAAVSRESLAHREFSSRGVSATVVDRAQARTEIVDLKSDPSAANAKTIPYNIVS